jgi:ankyrin repeat protein
MWTREQKEEVILIGKTKSYLPALEFKKQPVLPTPECGFFALGITREQLVEKLLQYSKSLSHRMKLSEEIRSALMTGKIKDEQWETLSAEQVRLQAQMEMTVQRVNALLAEFIKKPLDVDRLIAYLRQWDLEESVVAYLTELREKLLQSEEALISFYEREETFVRYVNHYQEGLSLGYRSALLFVESLFSFDPLKIELFIWQQERDSLRLSLVASAGDLSMDKENFRSVHLLYDATLTQFDLLIEKSQWNKRASYLRKHPLEGQEAFSQLLAPQPKSFLTLPPQVMGTKVLPYLTFKEVSELARVSKMGHRDYQQAYLNDFLLLTPSSSREKKLRLACMTGNLNVIQQMQMDRREVSRGYGISSSDRREARRGLGYNRLYSKQLTLFRILNKNSSPLEIAFHYGHQKLLDYFYEVYFKPSYTEGGIVNYRKKDEDGSLLQWAIICRRPVEEIELIIDASRFPHSSHFLYQEAEKYHHEAYDHDLLYYAILSKQVPVLRALLSRMEDKALRSSLHRPLLETAIQLSSPPMVALLLEKGIRVNIEERGRSHDLSPLWHAASAGQVEIIPLLLAQGAQAALIEQGIGSYPQDRVGRPLPSDTALLAAVNAGSLEAVRLLVEAGAQVVINRPYEGRMYWRPHKTPLMTAVSANHFDMVKLLVEKGADPFQVESKDPDFACPFLLALNLSDDRILRFLLENTSSDSISKLDAVYALFSKKRVAAWSEREKETLLLLLQKGAHPNQIPRDGFSPLIKAITTGCSIEYIEFLLEYGADANQVDKEKKETPLFHLMRSFLHHDYAIHQKKALLDLLFHYGAEQTLHHQNAYGENLLYITFDEELFILLLQKGFDPREASETGDTLLHNHAQGSDWGIVRALINVLSLEDLNRKNKAGETPLALAVRGGHVEMLKLLLTAGADVNQADHQGQTPLSLMIKKYTEAVKHYDSDSYDEEHKKSWKKYAEKNYGIIITLLSAAARYTQADIESWPCTDKLKKLLETHLEEEAYLAAVIAQQGAHMQSLLSHLAQDESVFPLFSPSEVARAARQRGTYVKQQLSNLTWEKHIHSHRCPCRFFSLKDALNLSVVNKAYYHSVSKELAEAGLLPKRGTP